jgi:glycosyltransferase involved in cell wall biosynthesis
MIVERFPPDIGGSGTRFYQIAKRLSHRHEIDVYTLGSVNTTRSSEYANLSVHRLSMNRPLLHNKHGFDRVVGHTLSTYFQLLFRSYDIADVDIWPILPFFSTKLAKPKMPAIITWNVVYPFSFNKTISKTAAMLASIASKSSTHNISVSVLAKTLLVKYMNVDPSKIDVIPNGVDEAFSMTQLEPQKGRIVFVGRLEPQKRLDLLIKAFRIAKTKMKDAELHIIGAGPLRPQIMAASERTNGLYVHEPVTQTDKNELVYQLSRSWVFVSTSEFETYGLSIAESLSMGLPAVLTHTPYNAAIGELVKHEHNGLIVEHNQPEAIAKALVRLYENPRLWEALSHNARHSTCFHSWDEVAEKTEAVYEKTRKRQ